MDCREFRNTFSEYVDGELGEAAAARACRHLAGCEPCRRHAAAYRVGLETLRGLELPPVPRGFGCAIVNRVRRDSARPALAGAHGFAGALLVGVLLALLTFDVMEERVDRRATVASHEGDGPSATAASPVAERGLPDDAALSEAAPLPSPLDTLYDLITVRAGDSRFYQPSAPPYFVVPASGQYPLSRIRFEVPAVWSGR